MGAVSGKIYPSFVRGGQLETLELAWSQMRLVISYETLRFQRCSVHLDRPLKLKYRNGVIFVPDKYTHIRSTPPRWTASGRKNNVGKEFGKRISGIIKQNIAMAVASIDAMWFLPGALNVISRDISVSGTLKRRMVELKPFMRLSSDSARLCQRSWKCKPMQKQTGCWDVSTGQSEIREKKLLLTCKKITYITKIRIMHAC